MTEGDCASPVQDSPEPRCWDCGVMFRYGTGYGESQVFCSEPCAETYKHSLGA